MIDARPDALRAAEIHQASKFDIWSGEGKTPPG
jgi:hypothetical protein